jgi:hypothetical protein
VAWGVERSRGDASRLAFAPPVETDGWQTRNPLCGFDISESLISIKGVLIDM